MSFQVLPFFYSVRIFRVLTFWLFCGLTGPAMMAAESDAARNTLRELIENVTGAAGRRFGAADSEGHGMDTAKIIANPQVSGEFIAVYHTNSPSGFRIHLAASTDLINWTWLRELAGSNDAPAHQPTIKASGNGFVMAWEQERSGGGGNHVKLAYYASWADLRNGVIAKSYDAPMVLSSCANGTPNLYSASSTSCDVGFHYFRNCDVDRQARATTNWEGWNAVEQGNVDNSILYWGVTGNVGDRDGMFDFRSYSFGMIEGQFIKNDFGSWRCFLYDYQTGNADFLKIATPGGSVAFANPTLERITMQGRPAVVITLFLPSEGARGGDSAGTLIYYHYLDSLATSYQEWLSGFPGIDPAFTADPDGDGLNNFQEYAFGTHPAEPGPAPYQVDDGGISVGLTYRRRTVTPGFHYAVEWSRTLDNGSWFRSGISEESLSDDGLFRQIRASVLKGSDPQLFLRLVVSPD